MLLARNDAVSLITSRSLRLLLAGLVRGASEAVKSNILKASYVLLIIEGIGCMMHLSVIVQT